MVERNLKSLCFLLALLWRQLEKILLMYSEEYLEHSQTSRMEGFFPKQLMAKNH